MSDIITASEAAVGALENFVDKKVDAGDDGSGIQSIVDYLKEQIKAEKKTINVGGRQITEADLYRQIVDKLPKAQFAEIIGEIKDGLDKADTTGV